MDLYIFIVRICFNLLYYYLTARCILTRDGNPTNFRAAFGMSLRIRQKNRINLRIRILVFFRILRFRIRISDSSNIFKGFNKIIKNFV